jgi:hypothetical protein
MVFVGELASERVLWTGSEDGCTGIVGARFSQMACLHVCECMWTVPLG